MRHANYIVGCFIIVGVLRMTAPAPAKAQGPSSADAKLIHPEDNGYADVMAAYDVQKDDRVIGAATSSMRIVLEDKRAALRQPAARQALSLLRSGLAKPHVTPPPAEIGAGSNLSFAAHVRQLARLLNLEQYVLLADGKTGAALDSMSDSQTLAYDVSSWGTIGFLTGTAIDNIWLQNAAHHIDQFDTFECNRLLDLLRNRIAAPDPIAAVFRAEGDAQVAEILSILESPSTAEPDPADESFADSEISGADVHSLIALLKSDPSAKEPFRNALQLRLRSSANAAADRLEAYPEAPPPDRAKDPVSASPTFAERMAEAFAASFAGPDTLSDQEIETAIASRARRQLLAVHAAIHRYRWEHNTLPPSLEPLKLRELQRDPFTGQSLLYEVIDADHYTLVSAGPPSRDPMSGELLPGGKRKPITLPAENNGLVPLIIPKAGS